MKTFINLILASIVLVGFSQCGNSKYLGYKFEKKAPFKVREATYQSWVAGIEGGGAGITIIITFEEIDSIGANDLFEIDSIYFRNQLMKAVTKGNPNQIIGRYKSTINQPKDVVFHRDVVKEYGNEAPRPIENSPFELAEEEAVITYKQHEKIKYYKLKLVKKASVFYQ